LEVFGFVVSLLSFKGTIDTAKFFEVGFLVKYLSMGYWLTFLLVLIGLILTMKSAKVSPGYIVLTVMATIWLFPTAWLVISSFRSEGGYYIGYLIPKKFTFKNYIDIWTIVKHWQYARWFANTTIVAICNMIISTLLVLATSYVMSRIRFKARTKLMSFFLIVGMFPGFMSMIAVYYILKVFGLNNSLAALVIIYSSGAGLGYYVAKGFFDTISKTLDEAAYIDGATKWQVFIKIIMPLSKPIIVFTILGAFMAPWGDFMMPRIILGTNIDNYTVSVGLYSMLVKEEINGAWKMFCAGAVCIAIPISAIFLYLQKFYVEGLSGSVKG
jgi:arabinogalactan oligomer/maltooligosaccharide transport system permease protein